MSEPVRIYTVKGIGFDAIWEFTYNLKGVLIGFKILSEELNDKQQGWLFSSRFPYKETQIQNWKHKVKNVEIIIGEPDLNFDTFWKLYNYKVGKINAQKQWRKLTKAEQLNAIKNIKSYDGFLRRKQTAKIYPERYLKNKRFEDQFNAY